VNVIHKRSWVVKEDLRSNADPDAEFLWNWVLHLHRCVWKSMSNLEKEMNSALELILIVQENSPLGSLHRATLVEGQGQQNCQDLKINIIE
jgi:hypothetical protein